MSKGPVKFYLYLSIYFLRSFTFLWNLEILRDIIQKYKKSPILFVILTHSAEFHIT